MYNKINKILNVILWIVIPYAIVSLSYRHLGPSYAFGFMILICIALFLTFKAQVYTIWGRKTYMKNHDDGFKYLQKAYDTGKMNPQQALIYAYLLIRDGHIGKAERLITSIIRQHKDKLTEQNLLAADLNMAIILWKKNDLPAAIEKMEYVYSTGYRSTVHYGTLGVFYILNNQLERALEFCLEAYEYNKADASIADNLGLVYFKLGEIDKAKEIYSEIFEISSPEFIEAYYNYGQIFDREENYEKAAEYYRKALGCPEKFLSTVKLAQVEIALSRVEYYLK